MKIVIFASYLSPHIGGIEVVSESEAKAFVEAGQTVSVVTSSCGAKSGISIVNGYNLRRIPAWNFFEEKLNAAFPIFSPSLFWHSYKVVRESDIVHVHDAFYLTSLAGAFWARILHKPLVLTQHVGLIHHPKKIIRLAQKITYATTGKFIIRSSNKTIVLNSRVRDFLIDKRADQSKIIFLPNSIDTTLFLPSTKQEKIALRQKYSLPEDKTLALFVGRFVHKKGFTKLTALKPINSLAFVFVGGNAPTDDTREDHFFLGKISRDDIADIFKLCDIFVLPSEGEGFPVTVQEAMASGLPVITTDDPAYLPYRFNHDLIMLIEPTTPKIIKVIKDLLTDLKKQKIMGMYSREYALKNFDLGTHTKKLLGIYAEAIS